MTDDNDLQIAWIGGDEYRVFSHSDKHGQNSYLVDLREGTCECEHGQYNNDRGEDFNNTNACKHIKKACMVTASAPDADSQITMAHIELVQSALATVENARETIENAQVAESHAKRAGAMSRAAEAEATRANPDNADSSSGSETDPYTKCEELQAAFDEAADGMRTQVHSNKIWVNKSPDAPDWTFDAFLSGPDKMEYDPDNAPEDYFNNWIAPGDVDEYIEEVM